jgi:hypothetical protein
VTDQVSHPYKTTGVVIVRYNSIFVFSDCKQAGRRVWTEWCRHSLRSQYLLTGTSNASVSSPNVQTYSDSPRIQTCIYKRTKHHKPAEDKCAIKISSASLFIRQTASTELDISDIYMRRVYPAHSNICVIQRRFHYTRITEMDSQNLLIYFSGTPRFDMSIIACCFRPIFSKGVDWRVLSRSTL